MTSEIANYGCPDCGQMVVLDGTDRFRCSNCGHRIRELDPKVGVVTSG